MYIPGATLTGQSIIEPGMIIAVQPGSAESLIYGQCWYLHWWRYASKIVFWYCKKPELEFLDFSLC